MQKQTHRIIPYRHARIIFHMAAFLLASTFCSFPVHGQLLRETNRPYNVTTNNGRITEHYRTLSSQFTLEYEACTNDLERASWTSTNRFSGQVFRCVLMESQLKTAPAWDPEKNAPPLSPQQARTIAIKQAETDMGSNWSVLEVNLVETWGRWDYRYVWYYKVSVMRQVNGSSPAVVDAIIFITMDGKAAPYIERKREAKKGP